MSEDDTQGAIAVKAYTHDIKINEPGYRKPNKTSAEELKIHLEQFNKNNLNTVSGFRTLSYDARRSKSPSLTQKLSYKKDNSYKSLHC